MKENFNNIDDSQNLEKTKVNIPKYKTHQIDKYFTIETNVENYLTKNKFTLDIIFKEDSKTYQIIGNMITIINPKKFLIDFYSSEGQNDRIGREITVNFNNITSYSKIIYDSGLNQVNIVTNFNIDEYSINTQYYEQIEITKNKTIGNMVINFGKTKIRENTETPENEKFIQNPAKNITLTENYLF